VKNAKAKFKNAARNWPRQIGFACLWCLIVTIGVAVSLRAQGWFWDNDFVFVIVPFTVSSVFAGYLTLLLAQAWVSEKPTLARFSFFFALLCILTVGLTAFIFAVHFRMSAPQWSAALFSFAWFQRTFFAVLSASYLFSVVGLRLLMPWGLIALSVVSIGFSRGWYEPSR